MNREPEDIDRQLPPKLNRLQNQISSPSGESKSKRSAEMIERDFNKKLIQEMFRSSQDPSVDKISLSIDLDRIVYKNNRKDTFDYDIKNKLWDCCPKSAQNKNAVNLAKLNDFIDIVLDVIEAKKGALFKRILSYREFSQKDAEYLQTAFNLRPFEYGWKQLLFDFFYFCLAMLPLHLILFKWRRLQSFWIVRCYLNLLRNIMPNGFQKYLPKQPQR